MWKKFLQCHERAFCFFVHARSNYVQQLPKTNIWQESEKAPSGSDGKTFEMFNQVT